ncbi:MAG: glutamate formimidoyltransferase [Proteobacteria bacterium]|nr:glutamate formimidoyltransferase [Pseudomonadota bacterium]
MKLIECVPNFSEGRDKAKIEAISSAIRSVQEISLMDVDPGEGTNRTVYTFAGPPEALLEAAFRSIEKGVELIDMRLQHGAHPRIGACDVCPFVPLLNATMQECVELAKKLGWRVGNELGIPVYLYAEAAARSERKRLPDIRRGEYEGLKEKLKDPKWRPDFGPCEFNARSGATAVGARRVLVAFNVNLDTDDAGIAKRIAAEIRSSGSGSRRFESLEARGWFIPEYGRAQVTTNILDIDAAPLAAVFAACSELAAEFGASVTGSEIVGMVPERALADIDRLGLNDVSLFDPAQKILERALGIPPLKL